jgi:hypothetical protein
MLAVGFRNELVLAVLAHGAEESRFGIAGEVIALQRCHDKGKVEVCAEEGHDERNEHGSEDVDGIVRRTDDGFFASPLGVGHGCSVVPSA